MTISIIFLFTKMVETHKRQRKNTIITKITLTISNAEHIKQTLSTNKPYRHQQHLPKISQNVSGECTAQPSQVHFGMKTCPMNSLEAEELTSPPDLSILRERRFRRRPFSGQERKRRGR